MQRKFNIGDVVRLNSGGPNMTVIDDRDVRMADKALMVEVVWTLATDADCYATWPEACLTLVCGARLGGID